VVWARVLREAMEEREKESESQWERPTSIWPCRNLMYPMASRSTDAVSVCHKREVSPCQDLFFVFFSGTIDLLFTRILFCIVSSQLARNKRHHPIAYFHLKNIVKSLDAEHWRISLSLFNKTNYNTSTWYVCVM
jgi:hypothetical protein